MQRHTIVVGLLALSALALALAPATPARSDERVGAPAWTFDVQAVMVRPADAAMSERVPDWGFEGGLPLTRLGWVDRLGVLQQRGETALLLDGHVTAQANVPVEIVQSRARLEQILDRNDQENAYWKTSTFLEGVTVKLKPAGSALEYEAQVQWLLPRQEPGPPPFQGTWRVKGVLPELGRSTLVLSHREQVVEAEHALAAVEIYVFLTSRPSDG